MVLIGMQIFLRHLVVVNLIVSVIIFTGCTRDKQTADPANSATGNEVVASSKLLSTLSNENVSASATPVGHKPTSTPVAEESHTVIALNKYGTGFAYIEQHGDEFRVVHNNKPGKMYKSIESNKLTLSPDGRRVAYPASDGRSWYIVDGTSEVGRSTESGSVVFSDDNRHIAYEVKFGNSWYMAVDNIRNTGAHAYYDKAMFVDDSKKVMYIENTADEGAGIFVLTVSDLKFNSPVKQTITSPGYVAVNSKKTVVAAIQPESGRQRLISFRFDKPEIVTRGELYDDIISPVINDDGTLISYIAVRGSESFLVLNDRSERLPQGTYPWPPVIRPDGGAVGILVAEPKDAYLYEAFSNNKRPDPAYAECVDLAYSADGRSHAYVAVKNNKFIVVVNGKDGPYFDRTVKPKFSPDGSFVVYMARKDKKRFIVVADTNGKVVRQHPEYERIFDPVFTPDGKSVAYGAKEGNQLLWKVEKL